MNPCLIIDGKMPIQTIQEMYEYLVQCPLQFLYSPTIKEFIDPEFIRVTPSDGAIIEIQIDSATYIGALAPWRS